MSRVAIDSRGFEGGLAMYLSRSTEDKLVSIVFRFIEPPVYWLLVVLECVYNGISACRAVVAGLQGRKARLGRP